MCNSCHKRLIHAKLCYKPIEDTLQNIFVYFDDFKCTNASAKYTKLKETEILVLIIQSSCPKGLRMRLLNVYFSDFMC
jgi:hypothetical protein